MRRKVSIRNIRHQDAKSMTNQWTIPTPTDTNPKATVTTEGNDTVVRKTILRNQRGAHKAPSIATAKLMVPISANANAANTTLANSITSNPALAPRRNVTKPKEAPLRKEMSEVAGGKINATTAVTATTPAAVEGVRMMNPANDFIASIFPCLAGLNDDRYRATRPENGHA
jgi:hypothetical protein